MTKSFWRFLAVFMTAGFTPKSFAVAATSLVAGVSAAAVGVDPWPWVIGGFGAAVVYVKKQGKSRIDAVTNALISVMIGGLITPLWAAPVVAKYLSPELANHYALAFIFSALWPWLIPMALSRLKSADITPVASGDK